MIKLQFGTEEEEKKFLAQLSGGWGENFCALDKTGEDTYYVYWFEGSYYRTTEEIITAMEKESSK
jgi:hypothetical protein